jgi:hypothetical protein
VTEEVIQYLPLDSIEIAPQVRQDANDDSIRNLAVSLKEVGQLQPIRGMRTGHLHQDALRPSEGVRLFHHSRDLHDVAVFAKHALVSAETKTY